MIHTFVNAAQCSLSAAGLAGVGTAGWNVSGIFPDHRCRAEKLPGECRAAHSAAVQAGAAEPNRRNALTLFRPTHRGAPRRSDTYPCQPPLGQTGLGEVGDSTALANTHLTLPIAGAMGSALKDGEGTRVPINAILVNARGRNRQ
jgi:hypothetical protein